MSQGTSAGRPAVTGAGPATSAGEQGPYGVGRIDGLRPRRRPGDTGEVHAADVDLVDGLDPVTRRVAAAWLEDRPSLPLRRTRLKVLASYIRWLRWTDPAADLLMAGSRVEAYCLDALTTGLHPSGKPLARTTVVRRRAVLASFYAFSCERGYTHPRLNGTPPPTPAERRLLRSGAVHLAAQGRLAEAVAVALLEGTGTSADALARLTAREVHLVGGTEPALVVVPDDRGDIVAFPLAAHARRLLRELCLTRPAGEPLIRRDDGQAVDDRWLRAALADAALAAGLPRRRAERLHPRLLRARTVSELG